MNIVYILLSLVEISVTDILFIPNFLFLPTSRTYTKINQQMKLHNYSSISFGSGFPISYLTEIIIQIFIAPTTGKPREEQNLHTAGIWRKKISAVIFLSSNYDYKNVKQNVTSNEANTKTHLPNGQLTELYHRKDTLKGPTIDVKYYPCMDKSHR